jgi:hypothetical protein
MLFALRGENVLDRFAFARLDQFIGVEKRKSALFTEKRAASGFPRTRQSGEYYASEIVRSFHSCARFDQFSCPFDK